MDRTWWRDVSDASTTIHTQDRHVAVLVRRTDRVGPTARGDDHPRRAASAGHGRQQEKRNHSLHWTPNLSQQDHRTRPATHWTVKTECRLRHHRTIVRRRHRLCLGKSSTAVPSDHLKASACSARRQFDCPTVQPACRSRLATRPTSPDTAWLEPRAAGHVSTALSSVPLSESAVVPERCGLDGTLG